MWVFRVRWGWPSTWRQFLAGCWRDSQSSSTQMLHADVLSHFSPEDPILQGKIHAQSRGHQPHGRTHVAGTHSLLHARGWKIKNESHLQDLLLTHHQPMHHLLPVQQKSWVSLKEAQWKEVPKRVPALQDARRRAKESLLTLQKRRVQDPGQF